MSTPTSTKQAAERAPLIDPERRAQFLAAKLITGSHPGAPEQGLPACGGNWVNYCLGLKSGDAVPDCASPAIWRVLVRLNDRLDDEGRERLKPYWLRAPGTANPDLEQRRRWVGTDYLVHHVTPVWLEKAGLTAEAAALRALPEMTAESYASSLPAIRDAREKAWAKRDERRAALERRLREVLPDAADAAAADAAYAAAFDAAAAYAAAAAGAAAYAAAADAAYAAAFDAAAAYAAAAAGAAAYAAAADAAYAAAFAAADAAYAAADPDLIAVIVAAVKSGASVYSAVLAHLQPKAEARAKEFFGDTTATVFALLDRMFALGESP